MRLIILALCCALAASGQITTIQATDRVSDSRTTINNNFSWLNTNKAGLGTCAANQVAIQTIAGGVVCATVPTVLGFTPLNPANNLSDVAAAATARTNLGLGNSATRNVGTAAGTVAAGDDSRLSDTRTPTAHASTHATGQADALTPGNIGAAASNASTTVNSQTCTLGSSCTVTASLPSNPTACAVGQYVTDIAADGTLTCAADDQAADTTSPVTVPATRGFNYNNSTGAMTYNLPAITSAMVASVYKRCFANDDTRTGAITIQAPASTYISVDGAPGSAAGTLVSGGALGDSVCVVAYSTTKYKAVKGTGAWTNN